MKRRTYVASVLGLAATGSCVSAVSSVLADRESDDSPAVPALCPSFSGDAESVCVGQDAPVTFSRSDATVAPGDALTVTLANERADAVGLNPYAWTVYRREGDDWTQVAPDAFVEPWRTLEEGETLSWHVHVGGGQVPHSDQSVHVGPLDLATGQHAFVLLAVVDGDRTEFVAPFTVA